MGRSNDILDKAIAVAVGAHAGACRKGTTTPYIVHPLEAAAIAAALTDDREVMAAAVLHDVLEDTPYGETALREAVGDRVTDLVLAVTEKKRSELAAADTWLLRKQETIEHLGKETDRSVLILVLADKLSSLRAIYRDWLAVGERLWQRFNQPDKALHHWYNRAVADALTPLSASPAWQELDRLIQLVFVPK